MTRKQFVDQLAMNLDIASSSANELLSVFLHTIEDSLLSWWEVNIKWFWKFYVLHRKTKNWWNMHTKEIIKINNYCTPYFKPWKNFKSNIKSKFKS